jgi:two-component sensor histidine kinase
LKEAHEALEHRVVERTRSLKAANAKLEAEVERRTRLEAVLRDTLAQREEDIRYRTVLAQEIDHRTKNALMMASALLQIQARQISDPSCGAALMDAMQRLTRMAEVHALLHHGSNPESIDFTAYLHRLVKELGDTLQSTPGQVVVAVEADEARFGPDLVIPLGLIVNEAITNALKHAFPNGRKGRISVTLRKVGKDGLRLSVEDDGVGMPSSRREGALGLNLIQTFAKQIGGTSQIDPGPERGTSVAVTFPNRNDE